METISQQGYGFQDTSTQTYRALSTSASFSASGTPAVFCGWAPSRSPRWCLGLFLLGLLRWAFLLPRILTQKGRTSCLQSTCPLSRRVRARDRAPHCPDCLEQRQSWKPAWEADTGRQLGVESPPHPPVTATAQERATFTLQGFVLLSPPSPFL